MVNMRYKNKYIFKNINKNRFQFTFDIRDPIAVMKNDIYEIIDMRINNMTNVKLHFLNRLYTHQKI